MASIHGEPASPAELLCVDQTCHRYFSLRMRGKSYMRCLSPPLHNSYYLSCTMKSVAVAAFLALAATADAFVVSPASTSAARTSAAVPQATSAFMSRRVAGAPVAASGALTMSTPADSMNDAQQPTLEQVCRRSSSGFRSYNSVVPTIAASIVSVPAKSYKYKTSWWATYSSTSRTCDVKQ